MPIFTYICPKCSLQEDRLVSQSEIDSQKCTCECEESMIKLFPNSFNFSLKGNWYKTTKSY